MKTQSEDGLTTALVLIAGVCIGLIVMALAGVLL